MRAILWDTDLLGSGRLSAILEAILCYGQLNPVVVSFRKRELSDLIFQCSCWSKTLTDMNIISKAKHIKILTRLRSFLINYRVSFSYEIVFLSIFFLPFKNMIKRSKGCLIERATIRGWRNRNRGFSKWVAIFLLWWCEVEQSPRAQLLGIKMSQDAQLLINTCDWFALRHLETGLISTNRWLWFVQRKSRLNNISDMSYLVFALQLYFGKDLQTGRNVAV